MQFNLPTLASGLTLAFLLPQANAQTPDKAEPATQLSTVNVTTGQTKSFKSNVVQVGTFRDMAPLDVPQTSNVITREVPRLSHKKLLHTCSTIRAPKILAWLFDT